MIQMERQMSLFEDCTTGDKMAFYPERFKAAVDDYYKMVERKPKNYTIDNPAEEAESINRAVKFLGLKTPNPLEPKFFGSDYVPKEDDKRLTGNIEKVFSLMQDGGWRTLQEIERATSVPAASVSANLRHLKREAYGSHNLTKRIRGERSGGLWEYKIIINK